MGTRGSDDMTPRAISAVTFSTTGSTEAGVNSVASGAMGVGIGSSGKETGRSTTILAGLRIGGAMSKKFG